MYLADCVEPGVHPVDVVREHVDGDVPRIAHSGGHDWLPLGAV